MIRINLLPVKDVQKKEKLKVQLLVLVLVLLVFGAGCFGLYTVKKSRISEMNDEISAKKTEIARLRKTIGEVGRFKKRQKELREKLEILEKLRQAKTGPVHLLDELSKAMTEKVWLTSFKETSGAITISGVGLNEETVAQFMEDLEDSPYYQNVELQVIQQKNQSGMKVQQFSLSSRAESPQKDTEKQG